MGDQYSSTLLPYRKVAGYLADLALAGIKGDLDPLGNDREDYRSILLIRAWDTHQRFVERNPLASERDTQKYVFASLWNCVRDYERQRVTHRYRYQHVPFVEAEMPSSDWEDREELRICVRQAVDNNPGVAWGALVSLLLEQAPLTRTQRRYRQKLRGELATILQESVR